MAKIEIFPLCIGYSCTTLWVKNLLYFFWLPLKIDKVAITHLAMEINFQTTDHVVAVEKVPEQHIGNKHSDACIYLPPYKLDVLKITYFNKVL